MKDERTSSEFEYIYDEQRLMCNHDRRKTSEHINYASLNFHHYEFSEWNLIKFNFLSRVKSLKNYQQSKRKSFHQTFCDEFKMYLILTSSHAHTWMKSHAMKRKNSDKYKTINMFSVDFFELDGGWKRKYL